MNRQKWLIVALIISWSLNVALGTALWLGFNRSDRGKRIMIRKEIRELPLPPLPEGAMKELKNRAMPLHKAHRGIMREMRQLYLQDNLDTLRFTQLADSLATIKGNIQTTVLNELARIHPTLNPDQRQRFFNSTIDRMQPGGINRGNRPHTAPDCLPDPDCPVPPCDSMEPPLPD